jgi:hypothetical protein
LKQYQVRFNANEGVVGVVSKHKRILKKDATGIPIFWDEKHGTTMKSKISGALGKIKNSHRAGRISNYFMRNCMAKVADEPEGFGIKIGGEQYHRK